MLKPLVPKFNSDLSVRLREITEKQVPVKLKPIVDGWAMGPRVLPWNGHGHIFGPGAQYVLRLSLLRISLSNIHEFYGHVTDTDTGSVSKRSIRCIFRCLRHESKMSQMKTRVVTCKHKLKQF